MAVGTLSMIHPCEMNTLRLSVILLCNSNSFLTGKSIASSLFRVVIWTLERNKSFKAARLLTHNLTSKEEGRLADWLSSVSLDSWHCVTLSELPYHFTEDTLFYESYLLHTISRVLDIVYLPSDESKYMKRKIFKMK